MLFFIPRNEPCLDEEGRSALGLLQLHFVTKEHDRMSSASNGSTNPWRQQWRQ